MTRGANSDGRFAKIMESVFKSLLFLSAYAPLGIILALVVWSESHLYSIVLAAAAIISALLLMWFLNGLKRSSSDPVPIEQLQRRDEQILSYIVTYAIPFLAVPFESKGMAFGLFAFFVLIWFLQVRLNLLYINPVLSLFKYHLYEVTTSGVTKLLISKRRLGPDSVLYAVKVGDTMLWDKDNGEVDSD